jgi:hypothetical protein
MLTHRQSHAIANTDQGAEVTNYVKPDVLSLGNALDTITAILFKNMVPLEPWMIRPSVNPAFDPDE